MLDLLLVMSLGFLGSFGHCIGMCGPLTLAFSLPRTATPVAWYQQLGFHTLLNGGRILSYTCIGGAIGALGSVLVAGGQLAGIDSGIRQGLTVFTGVLLIWMGLTQINPTWLPRLPLLHPLLQQTLHHRLQSGMLSLSAQFHWWTPIGLGFTWGLIPCGFLYTAQIKAAETSDLWRGAATMLAFGLGTLPSMLGVGTLMSQLGADRRGQLFRLGGWVTLAIGIVTLFRTGAMVDYTGHAALLGLMLTLIARPISRFWAAPLQYRRGLGVGTFLLSIAHLLHSLDHTLNWNLSAIAFLWPTYQWGMGAGVGAFILLLPAALTSADRWVRQLGQAWRKIHLLTIPAFILVAVHTILLGSHYLGSMEWTMAVKVRTGLLSLAVVLVLLMRSRLIWSLLRLEQYYVASPR